jgi:hypothetical protein
MTQKQLTPEASAQDFLSKTPRGTEFEFQANRTGSHNNDGTVFYNYEGRTRYLFKSIEDFVDYFFFDKDVEHEESTSVVTRTEEGSIDWEEHILITNLT